ncbi:M6 family metalloprotease domain-containing protein [Candidatus Poribacteria bacterium]|nr:M6 family metalloprotease domain-containing protein [Candidatus Poribacteria bacterium]
MVKKNSIKLISILLTIFQLLCFRSLLFACLADQTIFEISQPDGKSFKAIKKGDEWSHWHETDNGYTIIKDENTGWWYYAAPDPANGIKISPYTVGQISPEKLNIKRALRPIEKVDHPKYRKSIIVRSGLKNKLISTPKTQKILVILIDFNDFAGRYTSESFKSLFFSSNNKSVTDYYNNMSNGKFNISPATETFGNNDGIVGWLRLDQDHPDCGDLFQNNSCFSPLVTSAIHAADPYINFSSYDSNNDGEITPDELSIIIVVAGYESSYPESQSPEVWAHRWQTQNFVNVDGKKVQEYALFGEIHNDHQATIGIISHELAHLMLDIPDLYDSDKSSRGIGGFDLMSAGSWGNTNTDTYPGQTPVSFSAWTKIYAGFNEPTTITNQSLVMLSADSNNHTIIKLETKNNSEYFLLENRYLAGYDAGLERWFENTQQTGGIAIWHIDESMLDNGKNNNENHKLVDLEEADGNQELDGLGYTGKLNDLYYEGNNTNFNDFTNPNSNLYDGSFSNISITNISASSPAMNLDVQTGVPIHVPAILNFLILESKESIIQTFDISNIVITPIQIKSISISGTNASEFVIKNIGSITNIILAPSESITVEIEFTPKSFGEKNAIINIETNDPIFSNINIKLMAAPPEPSISTTNDIINFGNITVGTRKDIPIEITNIGKVNLEIDTIRIIGHNANEFSFQMPEEKIIPPSDKKNIIITFLPTYASQKSASLSIISNDPDIQILDIPLTGRGVSKNITTSDSGTNQTICLLTKLINTHVYFKPYLKNLASYRDEFLLPNLFGKKIVEIYYKYYANLSVNTKE